MWDECRIGLCSIDHVKRCEIFTRLHHFGTAQACGWIGQDQHWRRGFARDQCIGNGFADFAEQYIFVMAWHWIWGLGRDWWIVYGLVDWSEICIGVADLDRRIANGLAH